MRLFPQGPALLPLGEKVARKARRMRGRSHCPQAPHQPASRVPFHRGGEGRDGRTRSAASPRSPRPSPSAPRRRAAERTPPRRNRRLRGRDAARREPAEHRRGPVGTHAQHEAEARKARQPAHQVDPLGARHARRIDRRPRRPSIRAASRWCRSRPPSRCPCRPGRARHSAISGRIARSARSRAAGASVLAFQFVEVSER